MRAFLIDPEQRTIAEVEYNGDFHQIYELIDAPAFDVAPLSNGDAIYVDDEGLLKADRAIFRIEYHHLAGKGLVLGSDDEGETTEPSTSLEKLRRDVQWTLFRTRGEL